MQNYLLKSMPPQAAKIYRLLENSKAMTAKEIGRKLRIFPNAVYRSVKQLLELGFVRHEPGYPARFKINQPETAMAEYLSVINQNFQQAFGMNRKSPTREPLQLAFIKSRDELLKLVNKDVARARNSADLLVSGHEVPAETILHQKQAVDRGARFRIISQRFDPESEHMYRNMQKMGFEVRYGANINARIFIVDNKIVYFTSYEVKDKEKAIGMRFAYAPYARLMSDFFEQRWRQANEY